MMPRCSIPALLALAAFAQAADTYAVQAIPAPDRVVVAYRGLNVSLPLALLAVPAEPDQRKAMQDRLTALVAKERVEILIDANFGTAEDGTQRVQLVTAKGNVNERLVAEGLAGYATAGKPDSAFESTLRRAEDKARKAALGRWSAAKPLVAAAAPAPTAAPASAAVKPASKPAPAAARFVSELDSTTYLPVDSPEAAHIPAPRAIFYRDEDSAKKAGKKPAQAPTRIGTRDEASADARFAKGKALYAQAVEAGNTTGRDDLYGQANVELTAAMAIYSELAETRGDDEKLGEKMRVCNQLRYGSIKQRRFSH
jgi:hypothetical protein